MKNAPFYVGQRVVRTGPSNHIVKKGDVGTVCAMKHCKCGKWQISLSEWPGSGPEREEVVNCCGDVLTNEGLYWAHANKFAPIREVRDHKRVAVPEELLVIKEGDILEPSKPVYK